MLPRAADPSAFPPAVNRGLCFSSRPPAFLARCFVDVGHPDWDEMKFNVVLNLLFLKC